ncbi:aminoglycoside phosphotransferase family protein [Microbacteriaceae bacterium VKM Ac-2855]|nr:aminoglycoside phosphotransferase family protein [Microbacteriaceae bacterium VKM Ac-2855]
MHPDEVAVDEALVQALIAAQFPHWARLPVTRVPSIGTDNAMFRLGDALVARLPRIHWAVEAVAHEQRWLPRIALPVPVPRPVALGHAGLGFPWPWSVYEWLDGASAREGALGDPLGVAADIADVLRAFRAMPIEGAPAAGRTLPERDADSRQAIRDLDGLIDTSGIADAWQRALDASAWNGQAVWLHGDLSPGNLLLREDRLAAVIDFSGTGVGDPANDLRIAWNLLPASARDLLRTDVDADTWARGRGYALSQALVQLPYYHRTNPGLAANARHTIAAVLDD